MSARSKARKRAVDLIYAAELRKVPVADLLEESSVEKPLNPYTVTLVEGWSEHSEEIDSLLASFARGWSLDRMPAVDRNVLRIATFELVFSADIPDAVAITEAVKLVGELSTDESPAFVNGVLASVAREGRSKLKQPASPAGADEDPEVSG
ncbi:MAG TPA: transcription antitermination factor NusB [Marmoricola sp.]|nr:transcription antitermination factor NusB [Nocardioidaceae bacterium]MCB8992626.1 transcription antitermination factor NusB [Nocardioidaceae bacterium]MCO5324278.1 transcription antitermination factor NusB [Nocardioidaceae bacterium]HRV68267.1 transcription antitermination factor NusB [Marmoricola sp.]